MGKTVEILPFYILLIWGCLPILVRALPPRWEIGLYSQCTRTCGRGTQTRSVICVDSTTGSRVPERTCPFPRPSATRNCAIIACAPEWFSGMWGKCSRSCGRGIQQRSFRCKRRLANGRIAVVSNDYCPRAKPGPVKKKCGYKDCPSRYVTKKWSSCSVTCGEGFQIRPVKCQHIPAGKTHGAGIGRSFCRHLDQPANERSCRMPPCPGNATNVEEQATKFSKSPKRKKPRRIKRERKENSLIRRLHASSSRWRNINLERGKIHRCSRLRSLRSHSRRIPDFDNFPCLKDSDLKFLPEPQIRQIPPTQVDGRQALRESTYTEPYIVHNNFLPYRSNDELTAHVGGTLTVSDTDTITIICEASGYPTPVTEWWKDSETLPDDDRHILLDDGSLRIIRPYIYDSGNYTCVATNIAGTYSASITLSVAKKPRIRLTRKDTDQFGNSDFEVRIGSVIRASPGSSIRIACPVEGFPPPRIRWEKDVAGLGDNVRILPDNTLEIDLASPVDQGLYNCEATNPIGTDFRSTTLLLFEAPRLQEYLTSEDIPVEISQGLPRLLMAGTERPVYKIDESATALIGCPVTGYGDMDTFWTHNGQPIGLSLLDSQFEILVDGKVLFLESVDESSIGSYSCHSSNEAGNLTASLEIHVAEYAWVRGQMTSCSHACGPLGFKSAPVKCIREGEEEVDGSKCNQREKPIEDKISCNRVDCAPRFDVGEWSSCSVTCGNGSRRRKVSCLVQKGDGAIKSVNSDLCEESEGGNRPLAVEDCHAKACPRWVSGSWSQCGDKCYGVGMGVRMRLVQCINAEGVQVSRLLCQQSLRPKWRELCFTLRCEPVWVVGKWSSCSHTCGAEGIQTRILNCVYRGNRRQRASDSCDTSKRPPVTTPCGRMSCSAG